MYESMSNKELLQILVAERSGERVSEALLTMFPSLPHALAYSSEEELCLIQGVGRSRARQLKAVFELSKRLYTISQNPGRIIKSPDDAATLLMPDLRFMQKERFITLLLNTKNVVIETRHVAEGSLNACIVHPREVYSWAVKRGAAGIICAHCHPSGDPEPSQEDLDTTRRLEEAGNVLGVKLLDHIIMGCGTGRYVSLKERGLM